MHAPTQIVLAVGQLDFTGNIIPHAWYQHLTKPVKVRKEETTIERPYLEAIILLSDICYWYRPKETRDEATGQIIAIEKKFAADKMQRSYQQFAAAFGLTKDQVRNALKWLETKGLITLELRTISVKGMPCANVLFIEPVPSEITKIQYPPGTPMGGYPQAWAHPPSSLGRRIQRVLQRLHRDLPPLLAAT